jgi:hypothetical protein|tara:strand:+ start:4243 stop:4485 length:243 start_codon:yes stop_codon:yes gene_type:complete
LDDETVDALCCEQGVYPHRIKQLTQDFVCGAVPKRLRYLKPEILSMKNAAFKKEFNRKDRALAETVALFVRQKNSKRSGE